MKWNCVIKTDQLFLIEKGKLTHYVTTLKPLELKLLNQALAIAIGLE